MARQPPRLTLVVTPNAQRDLRGLWRYTADNHGQAKADAYIDLLDQETVKLETDYFRGRSAAKGSDVRHITVRKGQGHGHVVVYRIVCETVEVLRYFHTAQDWKGNIERGEF